MAPKKAPQKGSQDKHDKQSQKLFQEVEVSEKSGKKTKLIKKAQKTPKKKKDQSESEESQRQGDEEMGQQANYLIQQVDHQPPQIPARRPVPAPVQLAQVPAAQQVGQITKLVAGTRNNLPPDTVVYILGALSRLSTDQISVVYNLCGINLGMVRPYIENIINGQVQAQLAQQYQNQQGKKETNFCEQCMRNHFQQGFSSKLKKVSRKNNQDGSNYESSVGPTVFCDPCQKLLQKLDDQSMVHAMVEKFVKLKYITANEMDKFLALKKKRGDLGQNPDFRYATVQGIVSKSNVTYIVITVPLGPGLPISGNNLNYQRFTGTRGTIVVLCTEHRKITNLYGNEIFSNWDNKALDDFAAKKGSVILPTIQNHQKAMNSRELYDFVYSHLIWRALSLRWGTAPKDTYEKVKRVMQKDETKVEVKQVTMQDFFPEEEEE